ncbi:AAA family ATPase [Ralstonia pseudosolanacearum]
MTRISAIRLNNLRALQDTGFISIKPITILVGKNSVGKSTFARAFPLLRQSSEAKRRAPILWWGKYVDFGSFKDSVYQNDQGNDISFSFEIDLDSQAAAASGDDIFFTDFIFPQRPSKCVVELNLATTEGERTYVKTTKINFEGLAAIIEADTSQSVTRISVGNKVWQPTDEHACVAESGQLLPALRWLRKVKDAKFNYYLREASTPFFKEILSVVRKLAHGNTDDSKVREIANQIPFGPPSELLARLRKLRGPASWRRSVEKMSEGTEEFENLQRLAFLHHLPAFLNYIDHHIDVFVSGIRYIEPLRATANRFYRVQELAVDEIDSRGDNLAMFLYSMPYNRLRLLNEWLESLLSFSVEPIRLEGHISLKLRTRGSTLSANLADTGFGLSQVLPIAVQLWASMNQSSGARRRRASSQSCFVVEQPELHLHPAFQESIADLFVAAVRPEDASPSGLRIVAETHSPNLINRLGELVCEKRISADEIQILLFEQTGPFQPVSIRRSHFDEEGVLKNWPYGFFSSGSSE